jgi:hypothetical protein
LNDRDAEENFVMPKMVRISGEYLNGLYAKARKVALLAKHLEAHLEGLGDDDDDEIRKDLETELRYREEKRRAGKPSPHAHALKSRRRRRGA